MNDRSPLRRFIRVSRDFGLLIAVRVTYSKIRGMLFPSLALPSAALYDTSEREVSFLLDAAEHSLDTLNSVIEALVARGKSNWELCICEHKPVPLDIARTLMRVRGVHPWLRIVTTDESVDTATAVRWTIEQTTGQFVLLMGPGYELKTTDVDRLLTHLRDDPAKDAAILVDSDGETVSAPWEKCQILLQRKSGYLAVPPGYWLLTAVAQSRHLHDTGIAIVPVPAHET